MKEQRKRYNAGLAVKQQINTENKQFVLKYRSNISMEFVEKLNKIYPVQTIFTTRKLKSCLHSLKSSFYKNLEFYVVCELNCNGCKSVYVGQTCRYITTRVGEQSKADSPTGIHAIECNGDKTAFKWKILEQCGNQSMLVTIEALYIRTLKPAIITRNKYRTQELTLRA